MDLIQKSFKLAFVLIILVIASGINIRTVLPAGMPFVPGVEGRLCRKQSDCPPCSKGPSVCDLGICFCLKGGLAPPASSTLPNLL
ncbi:hypothetical protein COLO4_16962 [Corchorus olitorius]|uniref:Uncharacterized protein n=1 Tax=Corchorus olitorius TaxID=93759 RepID=A0A1R3JER6_9ROSI|nr:hypothetical protein COLO4_16962 [Corchorus olitorius]